MPDKLEQLIAHLASRNHVAVAFSGGVDSTFLLAAALRALGRKKVLAILGESPLRPRRELEKAGRLAADLGVELHRLATRELTFENFLANPPERCYLCKQHLLGLALADARQWQPGSILVEGSNRDDLDEFRPGLQAVRELGIESPLLELGFTKLEVRAASRRLGLTTWNQPAFSCLATRIPYSSPITVCRLERIEKAEAKLNELGFDPVRVRDYRELCRIEVEKKDWPRLLQEADCSHLVRELRKTGYHFVTLDLAGFRSGSLNPDSALPPASETKTGTPDKNKNKKLDK